MGAVPKHRPSSARAKRRRAQWKLKLPTIVRCKKCGAYKRAHTKCAKCGSYA